MAFAYFSVWESTAHSLQRSYAPNAQATTEVGKFVVDIMKVPMEIVSMMDLDKMIKDIEAGVPKMEDIEKWQVSALKSQGAAPSYGATNIPPEPPLPAAPPPRAGLKRPPTGSVSSGSCLTRFFPRASP